MIVLHCIYGFIHFSHLLNMKLPYVLYIFILFDRYFTALATGEYEEAFLPLEANFDLRYWAI